MLEHMSASSLSQTSTRASRQRAHSLPEASCCDAETVVESRPDGAQFVAWADRLKALADPTRLRMLALLVEQPEPLCVCEINRQFEQRQPTISHHLRILREAGLIAGEKRGVWSYFQATELGRRSLSALHGFA